MKLRIDELVVNHRSGDEVTLSEATGLALLTDVHLPEQCGPVGEVVVRCPGIVVGAIWPPVMP